MKPYLLYLVVAVIGTLSYHLGQKTLPATANPMVLLMLVYALAFAMAAAAAPFFRSAGIAPAPAALLGWPLLALAAGIFLIEIGFLLAYRHAAPVNWSSAAVNGTVAALLVPIAAVAFGESFSAMRALGIAAVAAGLYLLVKDY